ncbi:MAG: choice-of-anchor V domain-containing protein [Saprospiraceae bacterium]
MKNGRSVNIIFIVFFALSMWVLLANNGGVPQAVTKAPGEAAHNSCGTCHDTPSNFNPKISLEIIKSDNTLATYYTPGETYTMTVKVSGDNNPKAYGFQMAALDNATNSDIGVWSDLGDRVKQQNLNVLGKQRKYLVQSSAKTDGLFTFKWKAPATKIGSVSFYFAGLAINQNGNESGDNHVVGQLKLDEASISNTANVANTKAIKIFPNPTYAFIQTDDLEARRADVVGLNGNVISNAEISNQTIDVSLLKSGLYILVLKDLSGHQLSAHRFIKQAND